MTELFDSLSVAGDTVSEEDRVVYLLASLPDSYNVLVIVLEANEDVPKLEVVTERILHQERKMKSSNDSSSAGEHAMTSHKSYHKQKSIRCLHCGKIGHLKRHSRIYKREKGVQKETKEKTHKTVSMAAQEDSSSDENSGLVASQALSSVSKLKDVHPWIVGSSATSHMCQDKEVFSTLKQLLKSVNIVLGDGRALQAAGKGDITLDMVLPNGESKLCTMHNVLYNLLSVSQTSQRGNIIKFSESACYILSNSHKLIAKAEMKCGLLMLLVH